MTTSLNPSSPTRSSANLKFPEAPRSPPTTPLSPRSILKHSPTFDDSSALACLKAAPPTPPPFLQLDFRPLSPIAFSPNQQFCHSEADTILEKMGYPSAVMRAVAGSGAMSREELLAVLRKEVEYWERMLGVESKKIEETVGVDGRETEDVNEVLKAWSWTRAQSEMAQQGGEAKEKEAGAASLKPKIDFTRIKKSGNI